MKRTPRPGLLLALLGPSTLAACGDSVPATDTEPTTTAGTTAGSTSTDPSPPTTTETPADGSTTVVPLPPPGAASFVVTIENVSDQGLMLTPVSPGLWATHHPGSDTLFTPYLPDDGEGLEALAEDGDPAALAAALAEHEGVDQVGTFELPVGAGDPGPLLPGDAYEFSFTADPMTRLSLAMMVMGSNDVFIAPGPNGVSLSGSGGAPLAERDVSDVLQLWDAGTELDQAPGQGLDQALHGGSPNVGPTEWSGVQLHAHSTRALPLGPDLVHVAVTEDPERPEALRLLLTNVSQQRGTLVTALSPLLWVLHDDSITLFSEGEAASAALEALAEDGSTGPYEALLAGDPGVAAHGVLPGPVSPHAQLELSITPSARHGRLSLLTMLDQTNDAFLALGPAGVALFDERGERLSPEALAAAIEARLTTWDAGTELNEVPGLGPDQPPRQLAPDTGPPDPLDPTVHRYADLTDDLVGPSVGGMLQVDVMRMGGTYTITLTNVGDTSGFPGQLSRTLWAIHDDTVSLFQVGGFASASLQDLAEDRSPFPLLGDLLVGPGVATGAVVNFPVGEGIAGPISPGQSYELVVSPDPVHRFLSLAAMVMPSNDTFAALDPSGVALIDDAGALRSAAAVQAEIAATLRAWDAGTEGNQAGAAGDDMAPLGIPGFGPSQGSGVVRPVQQSEIWSMPPAAGIVRVTVAPLEG